MGNTPQTFLLLTILSFLPFYSCKSAPADKNSLVKVDEPEQSPELKMSRLHFQYFGPTGLEWELYSPQAEGYTSQNYMQTDDLNVVVFEQGKKSTDIFSDKGILITETSKPDQLLPVIKKMDGLKLNQGDMYLKGNVVVLSTDGAKLETEWLWFSQKEEVITTTAPVRVTRPDSITKGIGLKATSDLSSVQIYNQTLIIKSTDAVKNEK